MGCINSTPALTFCAIKHSEITVPRSLRIRKKSRESLQRLCSGTSTIPRNVWRLSSHSRSPRFTRTRKKTVTTLLKHLPLLRARTSTPLLRKRRIFLTFKDIEGVEPNYGLFEYHLLKAGYPLYRVFPGAESSRGDRMLKDLDFSEGSDRLDSIHVRNGELRQWKFRTDRRTPEHRIRLVMTSVSSSREVREDNRSLQEEDSKEQKVLFGQIIDNVDNICVI